VESVRRMLILGSISTVWRIRSSKPDVRRWRWRPAVTRCGRKCRVRVRDDGQTEKSACLTNVCLGIVRHIADVRLLCCLAFHHTRSACLYYAQVKSSLLSAITARHYHYTAYTSTASDTCTTQQCTLMNKRPLYTTCVLFTDEPCFTRSRILKLKPPLSLKKNKTGPIAIWLFLSVLYHRIYPVSYGNEFWCTIYIYIYIYTHIYI
jgi:hypothetical protein